MFKNYCPLLFCHGHWLLEGSQATTETTHHTPQSTSHEPPTTNHQPHTPHHAPQAKPSQAEPSQAKPSQAKPSHTTPRHATPGHAKTGQAEPSRRHQTSPMLKLNRHIHWRKQFIGTVRVKETLLLVCCVLVCCDFFSCVTRSALHSFVPLTVPSINIFSSLSYSFSESSAVSSCRSIGRAQRAKPSHATR